MCYKIHIMYTDYTHTLTKKNTYFTRPRNVKLYIMINI